jgi:hypothetical protein
MIYLNDDDDADYQAMDINFYRSQAGRNGDMEAHQLWPRIQNEGWTDRFNPDVYLYKAQGDIEYGIWPEYQFDMTGRDPTTLGWRAALSGEGIFWQKFDTLGDALDSFRDRNFRGYERLLPDPANDIDSDYERVIYGFAVARGEEPGASDFAPFNQ